MSKKYLVVQSGTESDTGLDMGMGCPVTQGTHRACGVYATRAEADAVLRAMREYHAPDYDRPDHTARRPVLAVWEFARWRDIDASLFFGQQKLWDRDYDGWANTLRDVAQLETVITAGEYILARV